MSNYLHKPVIQILGDNFWNNNTTVCFYTSKKLTKLPALWQDHVVEKYSPFSNFHQIEIGGDQVGDTFDVKIPTMPTIEHYFQAFKFIYAADTDKRYRKYIDYIAITNTANKAMALGNQKKTFRVTNVALYPTYKLTGNEIIDKYDNLQIDPNWDERRIIIMEKLVYLKFKNSGSLRNLLLETGDKPIVEFTNRDAFWGSGIDQKGFNILGQILVKVRDTFRKKMERKLEKDTQ